MIDFASERLTFRELQTEDVSDAYVRWLNDPDITRYLEVRFSDQSKESIGDFVRAQLASRDSHLLRISLKEGDRHIGNIKLGPINRQHQSAQISLFIGDRSQHGMGYATEAIERVTRWGFEACGLSRVEGGCYADNLGSLRAFLKVGYSVEGFRRSAYISHDNQRVGAFWFARLCSDWANTRDR